MCQTSFSEQADQNDTDKKHQQVKCFERVRERVAVAGMSTDSTHHDDCESEGGCKLSTREKQANGPAGLRDHNEVQKPNGVAGLHEELSHVGLVGDLPNFGAQKRYRHRYTQSAQKTGRGNKRASCIPNS